MTASAPIAGTTRNIPDAAPAPPPASGVPTHANFRSVLEQYQSSGASASASADHKDSRRHPQKDSAAKSTVPAHPAENPVVAQAVTPAVEAPDPILPFTTSITLRPVTAAPPDSAATPDSSSATDPSQQLAGNATGNTTTLLPPAIFWSTLGLHTAPLGSDSKTIGISTTAQAKTQAKGQAGSSQDSAASQSAPATPDPSTPMLPITTLGALEQAAPLRPIHTPTDSITLRKAEWDAQNSAAGTPDSSAAAERDSKAAPAIEGAEDTTATPPQGSLAFAARLSPTEGTPAVAPDATRTADSQPRAQVTLASQITVKQTVAEADLPSDAHGGQSGSQSSEQEKTSDRFAKVETFLPQMHVAAADQSTASPANHTASTSPLSPAARMDQVLDPKPTAPSGNHDITIRIPDANTDQGTAVRFVERAGEVHVSVRTSDSEMAQTLRGGLNDLVNRLEDGGIRTQVWNPGADASTSQNGSQQPWADPDGSNGQQYSSASDSEQKSKQQNKPRWVEELEGSIGSQNPKETTQLWQA